MDAQSPSKRFTRGISLHVEIDVEHPSFSFGLIQEYEEISRSCPNLLTCKRLDPNSIITKADLLMEVWRILSMLLLGQIRKKKHKADVYTVHNDKNEAVGSGSVEHHKVSV